MSTETDVFLAHYGVKGMKWGVRRKSADDGASAAKPKRMSRKEARALNKEGRKKFYEDKANRILSESVKKGDDVLVQVRTPGSTYPTVVTGREFASYAARGGAFDVRMTDIYATKAAGGYQLNESPNAGYQKVQR